VSIELIIESAPPSWILVGSLLEMLSKSRPNMIPSLTVVHMRHSLPDVRSLASNNWSLSVYRYA
jgi:hypothetical protein